MRLTSGSELCTSSLKDRLETCSLSLLAAIEGGNSTIDS